MKSLALSSLFLIFSLSLNAIVIDGNNITGDFANASWVYYQDNFSAWGENKIQAIYVMTNDTHLLIGIPGYVNNNSIVVLMDVNPDTGSNAIPAGLTQPERVKGMAGMRFDDAFAPDQAVSLGVNDGRTQGYPHLENIVGNATRYLGLMTGLELNGGVVTNGETIVGALMITPPDTVTDAFEGIEVALSYEDINNTTPTVGVMVVLANMGGDWANNQTLPPTGGDTNYWISSPSADHNASLIPGDQYFTIILPTAQTGVQFFASASKNKGIVFAQSSIIDYIANASGGVPPYSFQWDLGNGVYTNTDSFTYSYPAGGNFDVTATIADSGGNTNVIQTGNVKVYDATTVDGLNIPLDFAGKGTNTLQDTPDSSWGRADMPGNGAQLDSMYAFSEGSKLYVGVCGNLTTNVDVRVLGIFIDSAYNSGSNVMPLITTGFPGKLRNLEGMTFDEAFTPDKALLVSINSPGDFWVNVYHINNNSDWYWDTKTEYTSIFDPWQRVVNDRNGEAGDVVTINNANIAAQPSDATSGLECFLDFDTIYDGLSPAPGQTTIRLQVILYNHSTNGNNVSNQSLPGIDDSAEGQGSAAAVDYSAVGGLQYIEISSPVPEPAIFAITLLLLPFLRRR